MPTRLRRGARSARTRASWNLALAVPIGVVLAVFVLRLVVFNRIAPTIAENL